jgi:hypothetical protein
MKYRVPHFIPVMVSLALLVGLFAGSFAFSFRGDDRHYFKLLDEVQLLQARNELTAKQSRFGVVKEVWYQKDAKRLQAVIHSTGSDLFFEQTGEGGEIVEHLTDVYAVIQEEVIVNGDEKIQKLRVIHADSALYNYSQQTLGADEVLIEEITVPGDRIPDSLPSSAQTVYANRFEVVFQKGAVEINADQMKAALKDMSRP